MENKDFRNALLAAIKNELKDFTQVQKDLKKSRKQEFRPQNRCLQDICDEISNNASKISTLIYYYRWIKHNLKYWANRDIHNYKEYYCNKDCDYLKAWDTNPYWDKENGTFGDRRIKEFNDFFIKKCNQFNIAYTISDITNLVINK